MTHRVEDGLPPPIRYWAAGAMWVTMALAVFDSTIANVALPSISHVLGISAVDSIWIVNAYQIAIAMLLFPASALAESWGYRRTYMLGIVVFVVASLGCAVAGDLQALTVARLLQGFGAALMMANNGAMLRFIYPSKLLGRGVGYNALFIAISTALAPSVAAAILSLGSWRWLFAVNIPIGVVAILIGLRTLPEGPISARRFNMPSSALNAMTFAAGFLAVHNVAHGRLSAMAGVEFLIASATGILLYRRSRHEAAPLLPVDLMRIRKLRLSYLTSICAFAAQMIGLVALPFLLEGRFGFTPIQTGMLISAWPLAICVTAPLAGHLLERFSTGLLGMAGLGILMIGLAGIAATPEWGGAVWLVASLSVAGAGFGLFQSPNNRVMLGEAPLARSGAAAGMQAFSRVLGQTIGSLFVGMAFYFANPSARLPYVIAALLAGIAALISFRRTSTDGI
jgi:DHA2 family multidrug resistance protein-like MFS transporter